MQRRVNRVVTYLGLRIPAGFALVLLLLFAALHVQAQTPSSLTPEQLQAFQNLAPEQQKAIMDAIAGQSTTPGTVDSLSGAQEADRTRSSVDVNGERRQQVAEPAKSAKRPSKENEALLGPPRMGPQSTVLIAVELTAPKTAPNQAPVELAEATKTLLEDRRAHLLAGNPYRLNEAGQATLPSLPPITLSGLTASEATQRLNADPRLTGLTFKVSLLPVAPVGAEALKPFGYELFTGEASAFSSPNNIPVPTDYTVGPGDIFLVELFGKKVGRYSLPVDRDGRLHLPDLGPVEVAGLSFDRARTEIEQRVDRELIGVRASVTMGPLRSIQVFVTGDVNNPGSYSVSGLSTITNALFASGGISNVGSLRKVELKRRGVVRSRLDLYALLLKGDSSGDSRLEAGDVVFVAPVGATAAAGGEVHRPAIYEVRDGNTVGDLIGLAGGLAPEADPHAAKLERIDGGKQRVVVDLDLSTSNDLDKKLRTGDVLTVPRVLNELARTVTLEGEVLRPGKYSWHDQMRLTELLSGLNNLKEDADQRYILIRREHFPDRRVSVLSADAVQAFQAPGSAADPVLESRDRVIVFPLQQDRGAALADVLKEVRSQARDTAEAPVVRITGHTAAPGDYPLEPGMKVSDLIRAGGGLDEGAYALDAELTRVDLGGGKSRTTEVIPVDLVGVAANNPLANVELKPYDTLTVKELPQWAAQGVVTLKGEVQFPGDYPISKGERLSSVIKRAGGLTQYAFPEGAVFTREELKRQEREQLDALARRMQADLTTVALQNAQAPQQAGHAAEALTIGQDLLAQLRNTRPVGRLVINVPNAIAAPGRAEDDIQVRPGDQLAIPRLRPYVTVIGEVENPNSQIWKRNLTRDDYIALSGGVTSRADKSRTYVVRADGSVVPNESSRWFSSSNTSMHTGDTVVVPLDTEKMPSLVKWQAVTQILYNTAIAVAALHAL
jgi:protein involved in polysaccharide export with SLBB domain